MAGGGAALDCVDEGDSDDDGDGDDDGDDDGSGSDDFAGGGGAAAAVAVDIQENLFLEDDCDLPEDFE